jgi:prepilin peptidase CpaA
MTSLIGTLVLGMCAAIGGWLDVRYRRLPNWLSALTAISGLLFVFLETGLAALAWAAAHSFVALAIGIGLFRLGMIGGGDAKFYSGIAAWWPLQRGLTLLFSVSLVGFVIVLIWFAIQRGRRRRGGEHADGFALVPYGLAISVGALAARLAT